MILEGLQNFKPPPQYAIDMIYFNVNINLKKSNDDIKHFFTLTSSSQKQILTTVIQPVHYDMWPLVQYQQTPRKSFCFFNLSFMEREILYISY